MSGQFQHFLAELKETFWGELRRDPYILEHVRKRDYEAVKKEAQAIYQAANRGQAEASFRRFRRR